MASPLETELKGSFAQSNIYIWLTNCYGVSSSSLREQFDSVTQQKLFHPQISSYFDKDRRPGDVPIHDYLYSRRMENGDMKKALLEQKMAAMEESRAKTSSNSSLLVDAIKVNRFEKIFEILDSDQDGVISKEKINIEGLPANVVEVFTPLFLEMEEMNLSLNKQYFLDASEKLFKTFNAPQKNLTIVSFGKEKKNKYENMSHSFHVKNSRGLLSCLGGFGGKQPTLTEKTQEMTKGREGRNIYETLYEQRNLGKEKVEQMRKEAYENEVADCTFHPVVLKKKRS